MNTLTKTIATVLGLLIAGCSSRENESTPAKAAVAPPAVVAPAALEVTASGPKPALLAAAGPTEALALDDGEVLQNAAGVTDVQMIGNQGDTDVKFYGLAGGDPALNGLNLQIAFFDSPAEGWKVYRVGDFLDYRVLNVRRGRVDLEISESVLDEATGKIGSHKRRLIVGWTPNADGSPPATVTVTPAT